MNDDDVLAAGGRRWVVGQRRWCGSAVARRDIWVSDWVEDMDVRVPCALWHEVCHFSILDTGRRVVEIRIKTEVGDDFQLFLAREAVARMGEAPQLPVRRIRGQIVLKHITDYSFHNHPASLD